MRELKFSIYIIMLNIIIFLISANSVFAATISGTIYNMNLERLDDSIIGINTEPRQTYVAKNGTYMFDLSPGQYTIIAFKSNGENLELTQNIIIKEEGDYLLDLIIFPSINEENKLTDITQYDFEDEYFKDNNILHWLITITGIFIFLIVAYFILNPKKNGEKEIQKNIADAEAGKVLEFIKQQDGRTTQKDIRKKFPSSEAKISLIITELEKKGKIEKIKKGRGNIIRLK